MHTKWDNKLVILHHLDVNFIRHQCGSLVGYRISTTPSNRPYDFACQMYYNLCLVTSVSRGSFSHLWLVKVSFFLPFLKLEKFRDSVKNE